MTIVPNFLANLLTEYRSEVEHWLSDYLYGQIVQRAPHHLLVQLKARLDFGPLEAGCLSFHHQTGPGAKPTHAVNKLVRVLLVKYLYNWSLRETEERLQHDLVVKWFVGYRVLEQVVDHSQLERFEQWVQQHQHRLYFDGILRQIDQDLPAERTAVQIGDTFAMRADAAQETLVELLRHTSRCLLREIQHGAPAVYPALLAQVDQVLLFGPAEEPLVYFMSAEQKQLQRETTARGAWSLQQFVTPLLARLAEPIRVRVQLRVDDLAKILADEFCLILDAAGQLAQVSLLAPKDKGSYRLCSATDPDATARNHGKDSTVGYNISAAATPLGIIRAIHAATGASPDQAEVATLIAEQRQHQALCPPKLIYDRAAGAGRTRALVKQVSTGQTQLVARIPPSSSPGRLGPDDFHFDASGALVCPAGQVTTRSYHSNQEEGDVYWFVGADCQNCALRPQCRDPKAKPNSLRRLFISDYQPYIRQAQSYNQTLLFRAEMHLRPRIERIIFMLTHYDGARHARRRGKPWADFQVKMCATARNIRTWLTYCDRRPAPPLSQAAGG